MNRRPSAFAAPFATIAVLCCVPLFALGCAKRFPIRQFDYSQYGTVAVLPFQTEGFLERYGAEVADEVIIQWMQKDPAIRIVERSLLPEILEEHKLSVGGGGAVEGPPAAEIIVTGSTWFTVESVVYPSSARRAYLTATVRAFEPASGRIVWSARETGEAEVAGVSSQASGVFVLSDSELREAAIINLAQNIVRHLGPTAP